ncbi:MAG: ABC transporter permease [Acidobacteria bacterium]|nr:ABC transporter permease [Acidobacteriota bacterium]
MSHARGFTVLALLALMLGIGANATIFSLANEFLFQPLPIAQPDRAVRVYRAPLSNSAYGDYVDYRDRNRTLDGLVAFQLMTFSLKSDGPPQHIWGQVVSSNYFSVLGLQPAVGRLFRPDEATAPGTDPIAVLNYRAWQNRFGRDPDVVGRTINLNGLSFSIIGVAPRSFDSVLPPFLPDVYVPITMDPLLRPGTERLTARSTANFLDTVQIIGRMKPGVSVQQVRDDLGSIAKQLEQAYPATNRERTITVLPARPLHDQIHGQLSALLLSLQAAVLLVLLIACVNIGNLMLVRAAGRRRELALRQAIGASRGRLLSQLLTETGILAAAGGVLGLMFAMWASRLVAAIDIPIGFPVILNLDIDRQVLGFTALLCGVTLIVCGLLPAWHAMRVDLVPLLKEEAGATGQPSRTRLRSLLTMAHVALSLVLLVAAGLFLKSLNNARSMDTGFSADGVLTMTVDLSVRGYTETQGREFYRRLMDRTVTLPGAEATNVTTILPLTFTTMFIRALREGQEPPPNPRLSLEPIGVNMVGPGHFATLKIPLLAGRDFTLRDDRDAQAVAIVNERFARKYWPGESAIGKRFREWTNTGLPPPLIEVVGVARDGKYGSLGEPPRAFVYRPLLQRYFSSASVIVRSPNDPGSVVRLVRREIDQLDPDLPVYDVKRLTEATRISMMPAQIVGLVVGLLGVVALGLAAIGIYGVISYAARQRTHEIGVRIAIGADPSAVRALVVRQGMTWAGAGILAGVGIALAVTRFTSALLYDVSPTDPLTFAAIIAILIGVAFVASYIPARRASRLDPVRALRE